jgi:DNA/RNA-binding domain of Phe-tRNA-synthetase-like protein
MKLSQWECRLELAGWKLYFAHIALTDSFSPHQLAGVMEQEERQFRVWMQGKRSSNLPLIAGLRQLFREAGTDPTRYRISSESLMRRVMKGDGLPRVQPLVDFNNLLSLYTLVPCCVMKTDAVEPPLTLRQGTAGESINGLRGPFKLEGKPTLTDANGPFGTPITDDHRVILDPSDREACLVAYLPADAAIDMPRAVQMLLDKMTGIEIREWREFV